MVEQDARYRCYEADPVPELAFHEKLVSYDVHDNGKGYCRCHPVFERLSSYRGPAETKHGHKEGDKSLPNAENYPTPEDSPVEVDLELSCVVETRVFVGVGQRCVLLEDSSEEAGPGRVECVVE